MDTNIARIEAGAVRTPSVPARPIPQAADADERYHDVIVMPVQDAGAAQLGQKMTEARQLLADVGGTVQRDLKHASGLVARIPAGSEAALAARGLNVIEDRPVLLLPDPAKQQQGDLESREAGGEDTAATGPAESLYSAGTYTGKGVGIAILDSGVAAHPDLDGRVVAFADAVEGRHRPFDGFGHGTHVAGDAAGSGKLSGGRFRGPAPEASIVGIRVIGEDGGDRLSDAVDGIVSGLEWMVANKDRYGIRVANLSLGLPLIPDREDYYGRPTALYDPIGKAINEAVDAGITVVVAAGNSGEEGYGSIAESPAINPNVITVGALDTRGTATPRDDEVAPFSSRGPTPEGLTKPDVIAPGVNVMSLNSPGSDLEQMNLQSAELKDQIAQMSDRQLYNMAARMVMAGMAPRAILRVPMDQLRETLYQSIHTHPMAGRLGDSPAYIAMDGTSMASPIVAGVVADMIQANPDLAPQQVKEILMKTARPLPGEKAFSQGAGVVDPKAAIDMAEHMRGIPAQHYAVPAPQETPRRRGFWERMFGRAS